MKSSFVIVLVWFISIASGEIIPQPKQVKSRHGKFEFQECVIFCEEASFSGASDLLKNEIQKYFTDKVVVSPSKSGSNVYLEFLPHKFKPQGYRIDIGSNQIKIQSSDRDGIYNGVVTFLGKVRNTAKEFCDAKQLSLNCEIIIDWPDINIRGMDMQWCYVPPESVFMRDTVRTLAMLKYNYIVPEFGPLFLPPEYSKFQRKNALSCEDLQGFIDSSQSWNLKIIPKINSLGHMDRGVPWISPLGKGLDLKCEENYKMLFSIVDYYIDVFPNVEYFHFGMDESWECLKKNSEKYGESPEKLLTDHINKIYKFSKERGIKPIIYHDMLLGKQESIYWHEGVAHGTDLKTYKSRNDIPKDIVLNYWNYEAFSRYRTVEGLAKEDFKLFLTPWAGPTVRTMPENASLFDWGILGSTWLNSYYRDIYTLENKRHSTFYTSKWMLDALVNLSIFSWNVKSEYSNSTNLGFDSSIFAIDLYWDKGSYGKIETIRGNLPTTPPDVLKQVQDVIDELHLSKGINSLKGIDFYIDPMRSLVLGNIEAGVSGNVMSAPKPWSVCVDGQKVKQIDGIDVARGANCLNLYTRDYSRSTRTNQYGREVSVRFGKTHCITDWGVGNTAIPKNGYVLSGQGENLYSLPIFSGYREIEIVDVNNEKVLIGYREAKGINRAKIEVDQFGEKLVLLHTTAYEASYFMEPIGEIIVNYESGRACEKTLVYGRDICSYDDVCFLYDKVMPDSKWLAKYDIGKSANDGRLIYSYELSNDNPQDKILNFEIVLSDLGRKIGYILLDSRVVLGKGE